MARFSSGAACLCSGCSNNMFRVLFEQNVLGVRSEERVPGGRTYMIRIDLNIYIHIYATYIYVYIYMLYIYIQYIEDIKNPLPVLYSIRAPASLQRVVYTARYAVSLEAPLRRL